MPAETFGEDYLYFYGPMLGDERSDADAALIERLLALAPGMRVLDVPCGHGRIASRLAARGYELVGVDSSEPFIALARADNGGAEFHVGDMREIAYEREFDAVVNWFTSFGYFDPAQNDAVLAAFARALRPGGRLLLEMHNPARLARILALTGGTTASVAERDGDLMVDRISHEPETGRSRTERFVVRGGQVRKLEFTLEQPSAEQLSARLHAAGFRDVTLFGAGGTPFEPDGPRLIALAER